MGVNVENVLIGAGVLKIGEVDADDAAMVDVGATDGGVQKHYSATYKDILCDQALAPIDTRKIAEEASIKTNLKEATLKNLALAMGYPDSAVVTSGVAPDEVVTFKFGGDLSVNPKRLQFIGKGPGGKPRKATFYRCIAVGAVDMAFQRDNETLIPVEFRIMADPTKPEGEQLGEYVDGTPA